MKSRILIVDDERDMLALLRRIITEDGDVLDDDKILCIFARIYMNNVTR